MTGSTDSDFVHHFVPGDPDRILLLLHGTGGNESSLLSLGQTLDAKAALLSPRGKVLENGMPRFFRRLAEGIFDEADLIRRTHALADFLQNAASKYGFDIQKLTAVGYSNGANIAGALLLLRPETLRAAVLLRPMLPLVPDPLPDLTGKSILISAGKYDPLVPKSEVEKWIALLERTRATLTTEFENADHGLTEHTVSMARKWLHRA